MKKIIHLKRKGRKDICLKCPECFDPACLFNVGQNTETSEWYLECGLCNTELKEKIKVKLIDEIHKPANEIERGRDANT